MLLGIRTYNSKMLWKYKTPWLANVILKENKKAMEALLDTKLH